MRVLLLGGTRFIGPAVVHSLVGAGHEVCVFHRGSTTAPLPESVSQILGDKRELDRHASHLLSFRPDVVVDMAAHTEADGLKLLSVFRNNVGRIVVISSADVYLAYDLLRGVEQGPALKGPITEASPLRNRLYPYRDRAANEDDLLYHYDKILMEQAVMSDSTVLPATSIRLPMVYGPRDYQHRLYQHLKRMADGRPFLLFPSGALDWIGLRGYVEDIGHAVALCATRDKAANQIYHVGEHPGASERAWVGRIAAHVRWSGDLIEIAPEQLPEHLADDTRWEQGWELDSTKIRAELGYSEQVSPVEAMLKTIEWEYANPPANLNIGPTEYAAEDTAVARSSAD